MESFFFGFFFFLGIIGAVVAVCIGAFIALLALAGMITAFTPRRKLKKQNVVSLRDPK